MPVPSIPCTSQCHTRAGREPEGLPRLTHQIWLPWLLLWLLLLDLQHLGRDSKGGVRSWRGLTAHLSRAPPSGLVCSPPGTLVRFSSSLSCPWNCPHTSQAALTLAFLLLTWDTSNTRNQATYSRNQATHTRSQATHTRSQTTCSCKEKEKDWASAWEETWKEELDEKVWQAGGSGWVDGL